MDETDVELETAADGRPTCPDCGQPWEEWEDLINDVKDDTGNDITAYRCANKDCQNSDELVNGHYVKYCQKCDRQHEGTDKICTRCASLTQ